jgi:hypothetical protein
MIIEQMVYILSTHFKLTFSSLEGHYHHLNLEQQPPLARHVIFPVQYHILNRLDTDITLMIPSANQDRESEDMAPSDTTSITVQDVSEKANMPKIALLPGSVGLKHWRAEADEGQDRAGKRRSVTMQKVPMEDKKPPMDRLPIVLRQRIYYIYFLGLAKEFRAESMHLNALVNKNRLIENYTCPLYFRQTSPSVHKLSRPSFKRPQSSWPAFAGEISNVSRNTSKSAASISTSSETSGMLPSRSLQAGLANG